MIDFIDRTPTQPNRYKVTEENGGAVSYAVIERADEPNAAGTPLNRKAFMALQSFQGLTTVFNSDGSITETNSDGDTKVTVFNADGSITETFTGAESGVQIQKVTTFNSDGSISEALTSQEGW